MPRCNICGREMIQDMFGYYACWNYPSSFCNDNILRIKKIQKIKEKAYDT